MSNQTAEIVTMDNIFEIISDTVNSMHFNEEFYKVVDTEHLWDGTMQSSDFRNVRGADDMNRMGNYYECSKMLTYGSFTIHVDYCHLDVSTNDRGIKVQVAYVLPPYCDGKTRIRNNRIKRTIVPSIKRTEFIIDLHSILRSIVGAVKETIDSSVLGDKFTPSYSREHYMTDMASMIGMMRTTVKAQETTNDVTGTNIAEISNLVKRITELFVEDVVRRDTIWGGNKKALYMDLM